MLSWQPRSRLLQSTVELTAKAESVLFRAVQEENFGEELLALKDGRAIATTSRLFVLQPNLDDQGVM